MDTLYMNISYKIHISCSNKGCEVKSTVEQNNKGRNDYEFYFKLENYSLPSFKRIPKSPLLHSCDGFDLENPNFICPERDRFLSEFSKKLSRDPNLSNATFLNLLKYIQK